MRYLSGRNVHVRISAFGVRRQLKELWNYHFKEGEFLVFCNSGNGVAAATAAICEDEGDVKARCRDVYGTPYTVRTEVLREIERMG